MTPTELDKRIPAVHVEPHRHTCCGMVCYQHGDHGPHTCEVRK